MKVSETNSVNSTNLVKGNSDNKRESLEKIEQVDDRSLGDDKLDEHLDEQEEITREEIEEGVDTLNETVQSFHKDLRFELHEPSERMMTKLVNIQDEEIIKEFPPEEMLDMLGRIREAVGLIIDEKI